MVATLVEVPNRPVIRRSDQNPLVDGRGRPSGAGSGAVQPGPRPPTFEVDLMARNWTTKTLARELVAYIRNHPEITPSTTVENLLGHVNGSVLEEEMGINLNPWEAAE